MAQLIEDYALIGDCESAALIGRNGSLDWLCWPRFDSPACFAALLGSPDHGRWSLAPADPSATSRRQYRGDTMILETRFETAEGAATVIDFMPPRGAHPAVVRLVRGEWGKVRFQTEIITRFYFGRTIPWVNRLGDGTWRAIAGPDMVTLHTPVQLRGQDMTTVADFDVTAGDTVPFVLSYGPSHSDQPQPVEALKALESTEHFWNAWSASMTPDGEWNAAVKRSLLVLKALTFTRTGGIVAAPTTSLPEHIGGTRNWDYRFCWLRDATLALRAFMDAGYFDEARAWRDWLLRAAAGAPEQLQIMYGLSGERRLTEWTADWLPGYEQSRPVRIGNAAHDQRQHDVYGQVMDVLFQARRGGIPSHRTDWAFQCSLLEHFETIWSEPDEGIWEVRGDRRHFTYSKVMAWVAFDRAIRSVESFGLTGPVDRWRATQQQIHREVCDQGFDTGRSTFVQSYGSTDLDASLLLIPQTGFLPASDPRMVGTVRAIERELMSDGLVMRYKTGVADDGLPAGEGAFLACSFWLADAYVHMGRQNDARALFERLLALRNDVGLLAEEYDTTTHRQVGNFPQAFSHIALVNTARNLGRTQDAAGEANEVAAGRYPRAVRVTA